ncbi:hypothetical protein AJ79_09465 [Helicocarpus griseus UAMH5409]|uniref:Uncharacterized protein n=1 Tax=Helicocarpus griseus UAMH5409 TaxID=1447875 RepID=A0A2B7WJP9_9EURO|nr:hypothetical protein AJ79_09465 [Helicocarpus griseus UAMH5409]
MAGNWDPNLIRRPSQPQLALALAIVKSKPSNISIKDHILDVRRHIHNGRTHQGPEIPEKHLDSITFWREAYEKSESAQSKLLDRIYELEQRNAALALKGREESAPEPKVPTAKRKINGDGDLAAVSHSQKRTKTARNGRSNTSRPQGRDFLSGTPDELGFAESVTTPFLRHFHALQKQLQKKTDPNALVSISMILCESIDTSIRLGMGEKSRTASLAKQKVLQPRDPDLQHTLKGVGSCYPFILRALHKLSNDDPTNPGVGVIIYHVVQLFQRVLHHLHQYTLLRAKGKLAQEKPAGKKAKQRSRTKTTKSTGPPLAQPPAEEEVTSNLFGQFLATMVFSLNPVSPEENGLLEGFLFSILEQVGKTLCLFVFKELYYDFDLRLNSSKLPMPGNFDKEYPARGEIAVAKRAAELEAKHLVWILERAIAFTDQFVLPSEDINITSGSNDGTLSKGPSRGILERARNKLQNTLLKGIFGENEQEFRDSLKLPEKPPYTPTENTSSSQSCVAAEKDPAEWFTQEVWRLVGWDILLEGKQC